MRISKDIKNYYIYKCGYSREQVEELPELAKGLEFWYYDEKSKREFCAYENKYIYKAKRISAEKAVELIGKERFLNYVWKVCFGVRTSISVNTDGSDCATVVANCKAWNYYY